MDKVLYALKNRTLGYDTDYNFFLQTIVKYLQSPETFTITEWVSFEDFVLDEYCQNLLAIFLNTLFLSQVNSKRRNREEAFFKNLGGNVNVG